jgi:glyoxylase-like metal-dependent hydrolase (beta-lactamase superfamily II)
MVTQTYPRPPCPRWPDRAAIDPVLGSPAAQSRIFDGVEMLEAPGHTPGHFAVTISSGREQVLHLVDAAHHHAITMAHPEWVLGWDIDPLQATETRQRIFDRAAADRLRIFGGHMPFPGLGAVRAAGSAYEWLIEPWVAA